MPRRSPPLLGSAQAGRYATCEWKCGASCFRPPPNRSGNETFEAVVARATSRRAFLKGGMATVFVLSSAGGILARADRAVAQTVGGTTLEGATGKPLTFTPIEPNVVDDVVVPSGYAYEVLIRWGDPILADAPQFDFAHQRPESQAGQFGYSCDYVTLLGGLLWVNHEYTNPEIMSRITIQSTRRRCRSTLSSRPTADQSCGSSGAGRAATPPSPGIGSTGESPPRRRSS